MYLFRVLTPAKTKYSIIEKEAFALIQEIKRSKKFIVGQHFTVNTDHRALENIFKNSSELPKHASNRIQRWAIFLCGFDYDILYVRGNTIPHVDALNRLKYDSRFEEN